MFKASTDDGKTFGPKINLSNSTGVDSERPEIAASGSNVYVSWWERNATSNEPVLKISTDKGKTFGPILKLAANGTIGGDDSHIFLWNYHNNSSCINKSSGSNIIIRTASGGSC